MPERRTAITSPGNTMVVVERHQGRITPAADFGCKPDQHFRSRSLIDDEHVARHTGLGERRTDRRHGLFHAIERQDHHIGVVSVIRRPGGAGNVAGGHSPLPIAGTDR
jgi:hypothetical protein